MSNTTCINSDAAASVIYKLDLPAEAADVPTIPVPADWSCAPDWFEKDMLHIVQGDPWHSTLMFVELQGANTDVVRVCNSVINGVEAGPVEAGLAKGIFEMLLADPDRPLDKLRRATMGESDE